MLKKKIVYLIAFFCIFVFFVLVLIAYLFTVNNSNSSIPNVVINKEEVTLSVNNKIYLSAHVENGNNYQIDWYSSDSLVATVDEDGFVSALKKGTTIITAEYKDNKNRSYNDSCIINVEDGLNTKIESIDFPGEELIISKNREFKIEPSIMPSNAAISNISYSSNNENIVSIDNDGILIAKEIGRSLIDIVINDEYTEKLYVNVIEIPGVNNYVTFPNQLMFDASKLDFKVGDVKEIQYEYLPVEADDKFLIWDSSNKDVATVEEGIITCKKVGETLITVGNFDKTIASLTITVKANTVSVIGVSLSSNRSELDKGETLQLVHQVYPKNATNQIVKYTSSDENVATVDSTGLVTAKAKGNVTITISTSDGNFTRSIPLVVNSSGGSAYCDDGYGPKPYAGQVCSARKLTLNYNGRVLNDSAQISMNKGDTITVKVNLPTECGQVTLLTRNTPDGEPNWREYFSAKNSPRVNRQDCSTAITATSYDWIITANEVTSGYVSLSQTVEMKTTLYDFIKVMIELYIKVNP